MQIAVVSFALAAKHFPQEVRPSGNRSEQRHKSFGIDAECERLGEAAVSRCDSRFDNGKGLVRLGFLSNLKLQFVAQDDSYCNHIDL